jgi:hypothetical protein
MNSILKAPRSITSWFNLQKQNVTQYFVFFEFAFRQAGGGGAIDRDVKLQDAGRAPRWSSWPWVRMMAVISSRYSSRKSKASNVDP